MSSETLFGLVHRSSLVVVPALDFSLAQPVEQMLSAFSRKDSASSIALKAIDQVVKQNVEILPVGSGIKVLGFLLLKQFLQCGQRRFLHNHCILKGNLPGSTVVSIFLNGRITSLPCGNTPVWHLDFHTFAADSLMVCHVSDGNKRSTGRAFFSAFSLAVIVSKAQVPAFFADFWSKLTRLGMLAQLRQVGCGFATEAVERTGDRQGTEA